MGMRDMNVILEKIEQDVENSNPRPLAGHGQKRIECHSRSHFARFLIAGNNI